MYLLRGLVGLLLLVQASIASAAMSIEIIGAGEHQIPVAIVPFGGDANLSQSINAVIVADLQRTGLFRLIDPVGKSPHEIADVSYPDWQVRGADALVIGTVAVQPNNRIEANFRLLDVVKQVQLVGQSVSANAD
ncbi:MAG TPA: Tol-Pal system protein TolB, partial [Gallionella sp.]|nr:Tol-Pal system protein TolB [Gallionella sp.]